MPYCADCQTKPCRNGGSFDNVPKDCPTKKMDVHGNIELYSEKEKQRCIEAAGVEGQGYGRLTRIEEIMDYAYRCKMKKLGLAFCVGFSKEAEALTRILRENGFDVQSVCCKNGHVNKKDFGIPCEYQINPESDSEIMCNPAGQAKWLDDAKCDLVLILGLCVGHDTIFMSHCKTPMTYVAVKDRKTGNNPMAGIYCADGYFKGIHTFIKNHYNK